MNRWIAVLVSFVFLLGMAPVIGVEANNPISGTMMVVKGDVKVTSGKTGKTDPAKVGTKVFAGDTITSGPDSRAKIVMSDKNVLNISPESKITIEKYENDGDKKNVDIKVDFGKVRASVEQKYDGEKSKFNIKTPTAVAGVRGTDFITGFNPSTRQTRIVTFSGVVAAGQPGPRGEILNPVFVRPGMETSVGSGAPPTPPRPAPAEELKQLNMDTNASVEAPASSSAAAAPTEGAKPADPNSGEAAKPADQASSNAQPAAPEGGPKTPAEGGSSAGGPPTAAGGPGGAGSGPGGASAGPGGASADSPGRAGTSTAPGLMGPAAGGPDRGPAAVGGGMLDMRDLDTRTITRDITARPPGAAAPPPMVFTPQVPTQPMQPPTYNNIIDSAIRNQRSRVNINIVLPP